MIRTEEFNLAVRVGTCQHSFWATNDWHPQRGMQSLLSPSQRGCKIHVSSSAATGSCIKLRVVRTARLFHLSAWLSTASRHGKHVVVLLATMEMPSITSHLFTRVMRDRCRLFPVCSACVCCLSIFLTCLLASQRQPHDQPLLQEESRNLERKAAQNQATHSALVCASSEKTRMMPADPQRHCPHFNTCAFSCMHSGPISTPKVNKSGSLVLLLRLLPSRCSALQPATPPKLRTDPVALAPCS